MKDALDLANERIDQQAEYIAELEGRLERLQKIEAAESDALHKMRNECAVMVTEAQRRHLRCAMEHGCPKEYAV